MLGICEANKKVWDGIYKAKYEKGSYNKYPTEHIVVFMAKNYYKVSNRSNVRVLELGCGSGNNLVYLAKEGFKPYGIDYSDYAVRMCREYLSSNRCEAEINVSSAASLECEDNYFDACVESNTIHCNTFETIEKIFKEIYRVTKPGGKFFGILASDRCAEFGKGRQIEKGTFDFTNTVTFRGQFDNFPIVHFFTLAELKELSSHFANMKLELDLTTFATGDDPSPLGYWLLELEK